MNRNLIFIISTSFICFSCSRLKQSDVTRFEKFWANQEGIDFIQVKEGLRVDTIDIKVPQTANVNLRKIVSLPALTYNRMLANRASYDHYKEIVILANSGAESSFRKYPVSMLTLVEDYVNFFLANYESARTQVLERDTIVFQEMTKMDTACLVLDGFLQENDDIVLVFKCFRRDSVLKKKLEVTFNKETNAVKSLYILK